MLATARPSLFLHLRYCYLVEHAPAHVEPQAVSLHGVDRAVTWCYDVIVGGRGRPVDKVGGQHERGDDGDGENPDESFELAGHSRHEHCVENILPSRHARTSRENAELAELTIQ